MAGDGPERCLHPDRREATTKDFHRLQGPDENAMGHSWSIGKHVEDKACAGARYEIMLILAANGRPDRLDWVLLNPREAPKAQVSKPYGGLTMSSFLHQAKPEWSQKECS